MMKGGFRPTVMVNHDQVCILDKDFGTPFFERCTDVDVQYAPTACLNGHERLEPRKPAPMIRRRIARSR